MQGCAFAGGLAAIGLTAGGLIGNGCVFALASMMSSSLSLLLGTVRNRAVHCKASHIELHSKLARASSFTLKYLARLRALSLNRMHTGVEM
jgi:hypothetical protein